MREGAVRRWMTRWSVWVTKGKEKEKRNCLGRKCREAESSSDRVNDVLEAGRSLCRTPFLSLPLNICKASLRLSCSSTSPENLLVPWSSCFTGMDSACVLCTQSDFQVSAIRSSLLFLNFFILFATFTPVPEWSMQIGDWEMNGSEVLGFFSFFFSHGGKRDRVGGRGPV